MIISDLISTSFLVLALCIFAIVFVIRKTVEYFLHGAQPRLWSDLILPVLPILIGALVGHIMKLLMMGVVAGLLASQLYRMVKSQIKGVKQDA